jgi:phosphatidate phosphatase APP1
MTSVPRSRHPASRLESRVRSVVGPRLLARGWTARVVPYVGYGRPDQVRVLARVLLTPPGRDDPRPHGRRGWRRFLSAPASYVEVQVQVGDQTRRARSDRDGYVDLLVGGVFEPGATSAQWVVDGRSPVSAQVLVVAADQQLGVVSDIDDTVIVTLLPRPLVAFRNAFLLHEDDRRPVEAMARLYRLLARSHPGLPFVYLSTGAWNVAPALTRFLHRHGYPAGPLLLTDWGPTEQAVFRSGREHKRTQLRRLFAELPHLSWLLIGADGQYYPAIYAEAAREHPGRVAAIVIRRLSAAEHLATHGGPGPAEDPPGVEILTGRDGEELAAALRAAGLLPG